MELNLKLSIDQVKLIFSKWEFCLMCNERIYYGQRNLLHCIYKQLPEDDASKFSTSFPLLSKELSI